MRPSLLALAVAACLVWTGASVAAIADDLSKGIPSKAALQRKTALELAGLATFVAASCPDLALNAARFRAAVSALGVTPDDLDRPETLAASLQYTKAYKQDVKVNCERARTEYGPQGKTLADLFSIVVVPPKPPSAGLPAPSGKAPRDKAPGDNVPGDKVPGDKVPGDRKP